ncbi:MAG: hypothetical protein FJX76_06525 [Armatimonadetes bacterium]|nr:hypothetical protein [Armatimonadota bacterium]
MPDTLRRLLAGCAAGLVAVAALSLSNGFVALSVPAAGLLFTAGMAGAIASMAASGGRPGLVCACVAGILAAVLSGPNPSLEVEFGIDRFLLLPLQKAHLAALPSLPERMLLALGAAAVGGFVHGRMAARAMLAALIVSFLVAAAYTNPGVIGEASTPPRPGEYVADGFLFLRLHDLMREGRGFYPAFHDAYVQRKGETGTPSNRFNWRPPTLFWLWLAIPGGGTGLLIAFWLLAAAALWAAWAFARAYVDEAVALLGPCLLGAYYLYGACSIWFPTQEYWASFMLIGGLCALASKREWLTALLWPLAAACREQFVMVGPLLVLLGMRSSGRMRVAAGAAVGAVVALYLVHYAVSAPYVSPASAGLNAWRSAGPEFLYHCLQFGTVFLAGRAWILFPLLAAGLLGALLIPAPTPRMLAVGAIVLAIGGLLVIGQRERFYWGILAVPQMLACVPIALRILRGSSPTGDAVKPAAP